MRKFFWSNVFGIVLCAVFGGWLGRTVLNIIHDGWTYDNIDSLVMSSLGVIFACVWKILKIERDIKISNAGYEKRKNEEH